MLHVCTKMHNNKLHTDTNIRLHRQTYRKKTMITPERRHSKQCRLTFNSKCSIQKLDKRVISYNFEFKKGTSYYVWGFREVELFTSL